MKSFKFSRTEKIRLKKEVENLLARGRRASQPPFILVWRERPEGPPEKRFAIKLRRGFENAVVRNRVKRLLREVYRREKHQVANGVDLLMMVQPFKVSKDWNFLRMREQFIALCREAGLWKPS